MTHDDLMVRWDAACECRLAMHVVLTNNRNYMFAMTWTHGNTHTFGNARSGFITCARAGDSFITAFNRPPMATATSKKPKKPKKHK